MRWGQRGKDKCRSKIDQGVPLTCGYFSSDWFACSRTMSCVKRGIGSIKGALVAALMIGVVDTFGKVFLPQASGVLVYLLMAGILLWKPDGLFKAG